MKTSIIDLTQMFATIGSLGNQITGPSILNPDCLQRKSGIDLDMFKNTKILKIGDCRVIWLFSERLFLTRVWSSKL